MTRWGGQWHDEGWRVALWAPQARQVALVLDGHDHAMQRDAQGNWSVMVPAVPGTPYLLRVDGHVFADPASRGQVGDVHGHSQVMRDNFDWQADWTGRDWSEAVLYELHVGTFTPQGTLAAATERLGELAELGITAIELMPLGQFAGQRGWGYDGVLPFALHPTYGEPDDLRRLVDRAHGVGMMVILDLVMNHFGPEGAYLHRISPDFFDPARQTPWGAAIDFSQDAVRDYWCECAEHWLGAFRLDGLRLDAVHQIQGPGADVFLHEFARRVRALRPDQPLHLVVEDDRNLPDLRQNGYDASWNDDFHHAVHCLLTAEDHGYYASFARDPMADLAHALARGHVEEGQPRPPRPQPRGADCGHLPPTAFVNAIQTHDQIGNRACGERLLTLADPQAVRLVYALLLVAPYIPMLFMGEERGARTPFLFFADYQDDLAQAVRQGRAAEFDHDAGFAKAPDPLDPQAFLQSRMAWESPDAGAWLDLTRRALRFRQGHVVPLLQSGRRSAQVTRQGARGLVASWQFGAGMLRIAISAGIATPLPDHPAAFALGRPGLDPFALTALVEPA